MRASTVTRRALAIALCAFTIYTLMDTFVIRRSYSSQSEAVTELFPQSGEKSEDTAESAYVLELSSSTGDPGDTAAVSGAREEGADSTLCLPDGAAVIGSYSEEGCDITLYTFRTEGTQVYLADVYASSAQYLKTALADGVYGRNVTEKTSVIAQDVGAVLAVNGDYYGSRQSGYVIRNGVLYRDAADGDSEILVVYANGSFEIVSGAEYTAQQLLENGAWQVFSFGPGLVAGGEISVSASSEVGRAMASNPRTAIGVAGEGHYVLLVSDGRTADSEGLGLYQLACLMQKLGCSEAYNLDGGGSSTMVFLGQVVNAPTTNGKRISERSVSDIVYIG